MKSDIEIKQDVEAELRFRPEIDERDIAIKVNDSVVTLTGFVRTFPEKQYAEDAVKRIAGVSGVANDIEVQPTVGDGFTDPQITRAAVEAIRAELPALSDCIKVLVRHGHITLEGNVEWHFMRERAEHAVRRVGGVTEVINSIVVQPTVKPSDIQRRIENAFRRSAQIDAEQISVEARGGEVTLRGKVHSWSERQEAQQSAWSAPGVTRVNNFITISIL
jgi:osmotically-inducible protein OsmY